MEILLATVVASAVIFFGALISMGNERQRKAIDGLREQVVLWAVQDLKIKREHLVRTVQVPDPLDWLTKITTKICSYDMKLQVLETYENPQSIVCISGDGNKKIIFSPLSPTYLSQIRSDKINRLSQLANQNPLLFLTRDVKAHELSVLNGGYFFDLELSLVWKELTDQKLDFSNSLWVYEYDE